MRDKSKWAMAIGAGAIGGALSCLFLAKPAITQAQDSRETTNSIQLVDPAGNLYAELKKEGKMGATLGFYNASGKRLLEIGLGADGLPVIALMSPKSSPDAKLLFKLAGSNQSGTIIWRDNRNKDRMILGLDPFLKTEDPFLVTYDRAGKKKAIFGDAP